MKEGMGRRKKGEDVRRQGRKESEEEQKEDEK